MIRKLMVAACVVPCFGAWALGCSDDGGSGAPSSAVTDAGFDADVPTEADGGMDSGSSALDASDGATKPACGPPSGLTPRLLLSTTHPATSELVAFGLEGKTIDGRLAFPGFLGKTSSSGANPYLLESATDLVAKLDAHEPWKVVSTWNVAGADRPDGGLAYANPNAVIVPTCDSAYVVRYNRNQIAVLDTKEVADGGAPAKFIDLSGLVQADDEDGFVNMTSAVYVEATQRLYVLLGNNDVGKVDPDTWDAICTPAQPSIVGIDVAKGEVVSLGGKGPGGSVLLGGYGVDPGSPMAYDSKLGRLVVMTTGCSAHDGDAALPISRRRVEAVSLSTGEVTTLLSLDDRPYPSALTYIDETHAVVGFFSSAFLWDPTKPALGVEIPGGLEAFAYAGKGALVGLRRGAPQDDAGAPYEIVRVPFTDANTAIEPTSVEVLGQNPFTDNTGFVGGVEVWPHP